MRRLAPFVMLASACYSGSRAAPDVNAAWRGHARFELEARLGTPATAALPDGTSALRWTRTGTNVVALPSAHLDVDITSSSISVDAAANPGVVERRRYDIASAVVDPAGGVLRFDSGWLAAGIPSGTNLRTGVIFGAHGGMGALDDATSPMPSMGLYIGGMIGPRLALLGSYRFVNGKGAMGYAMGHAWGFGVQHWLSSRLAVGAGPAMVLDLEPGLQDPALSPGALGTLSYAVVRAGSFVLDLRFDATIATAVAFGTLGIGVGVN